MHNYDINYGSGGGAIYAVSSNITIEGSAFIKLEGEVLGMEDDFTKLEITVT